MPSGSALLVVKRGPNAGSRFLLDQPVTSAGRHPDSDILLDDVTVSRRHAEFRLDKDGSWAVADVGSPNGTYVNRQPVDSTVLANNDQVQIGKFLAGLPDRIILDSILDTALLSFLLHAALHRFDVLVLRRAAQRIDCAGC